MCIRDSANTVATADALEKKLKDIREKLPRGVELTTIEAVSYTHLDVYKRQIQARVIAGAAFAELVDFALC